MGTRLATAMISVVILAGALMAPPLPAGAVAGTEYLRTAYDGTIYEVTTSGVTPLTWEGWAERDFPAWRTAETVYHRTLTLPTVTALTAFPRARQELRRALTWSQYASVGFPAVWTAPWDESLTAYKWATGPEIFARDRQGDVIVLTALQWQAAGYPAFATRENRGFVRLSWDESGGIAYMCDLSGGRGARLTYNQWRSYGSPPPDVVVGTARDVLWRPDPRQSRLVYLGAMNMAYVPDGNPPRLTLRELRYEEWRGMGSPAPAPEPSYSSVERYCGMGDPAPFS